MASIGGGKGSSSTKVKIPSWLKPFVTQATGVASGALGGLQGMMSGDTVADLTPDQLAGLESMRGLVGGDFFGTAQDVFMNAAQGIGTGFLDPGVQQYFGSQNIAPGDMINQYQQALAFTQNPEAQNALEATARGDYLYGGEGFDAAINAAMNKAIPQIASTYGGTVGGIGSGLASTAVNSAFADAFASQYGQERGRQMGAASALDQGGRFDRSLYSGLAEGQQNRAMQANQFLGNMSNMERQRQMAAAAGLPDIGMLDANAQMQIGEYLQGQEQRELDAPIRNQLQLLMAALQGPGSFSPFLGSKTNSSQFGFNLGTSGLGEKQPWWLGG